LAGKYCWTPSFGKVTSAVGNITPSLGKITSAFPNVTSAAWVIPAIKVMMIAINAIVFMLYPLCWLFVEIIGYNFFDTISVYVLFNIASPLFSQPLLMDYCFSLLFISAVV
jgi:hypothetical protein